MSGSDWLYRFDGSPVPRAVLQRIDDFGIEALDLVRPPSRFWGDTEIAPPIVDLRVDSNRARALPWPAKLLRGLPAGETWTGVSKRSRARLLAWFLACEDPQRRLEAQAIVTLAHQASLVQHLLVEPGLQRVLVADEVGLGKTVEAGLLIRELVHRQPGLRVLYLAPARLCRNVASEFERLNLPFRLWVSGGGTATLTDPRIIASIHRATHPAHYDAFTKTAPWDLIVVDECHHLSDWAKGGGSPVRKYKLVQELSRRLGPNGRLLLMSGTPHQGAPQRFENLLQLLRRDDEPSTALTGRVIYRTKDDVRDWDGEPLFPRRQVNPPLLHDLGPEHRQWLEHVHEIFEPAEREAEGEVRRRAAGWRAGTALQWATSSIQAGLGFLVRQAIRAEWNEKRTALRAALEAIRPYRDGPPDEPARQLLERMAREIGQQASDADIEDMEELEEDEGGVWRPNSGLLGTALEEGVALLLQAPDAKWDFIYENVLRPAGDEKVVLFAQPIETVTALADYLWRRTGQQPARIVGNQNERERQAEIESFWRDDGPRYLVSSRAGGEGINLQVARRLVHVDVPWNPMELEQRVGRVHRFRSRRTIIVDTIVAAESREVDAYRIAREKLEEIARTLVPEDRFEGLFSRVMALVPPEELLDLLNDRPAGPLDPGERARLSSMVVRGFEQWRQFDTNYKARQRRIRDLDPGQATWGDLERFVVDHLDARRAEGFSALRFRFRDDEVVEERQDATVVELENRLFACGDLGGMPISRADGKTADRLGLNVPEVVRALRDEAFPESTVGAAHLRWPEGIELPQPGLGRTFGVLVFARLQLRSEQSVWVEAGASLHAFVVDRTGVPTPVDGAAKGQLVRALSDAKIRRDPENSPELVEALIREEANLLQTLRRPTDADRAQRVSHTIVPLLAAVVVVGRAGAEEDVADEPLPSCPACGGAKAPFEVEVGGIKRRHCEDCRP